MVAIFMNQTATIFERPVNANNVDFSIIDATTYSHIIALEEFGVESMKFFERGRNTGINPPVASGALRTLDDTLKLDVTHNDGYLTIRLETSNQLLYRRLFEIYMDRGMVYQGFQIV